MIQAEFARGQLDKDDVHIKQICVVCQFMHTNTRTYILSSPCTYLAPSPPCSLNKQGSVDHVGNQNRCSNLPHKITHTYIMVDMHAHTDTHSHTHSYTLVYHHTLPFNSGRSQFHPRSVLIIKEVSIGSGEKTKAFVSLSSTTIKVLITVPP